MQNGEHTRSFLHADVNGEGSMTLDAESSSTPSIHRASKLLPSATGTEPSFFCGVKPVRGCGDRLQHARQRRGMEVAMRAANAHQKVEKLRYLPSQWDRHPHAGWAGRPGLPLGLRSIRSCMLEVVSGLQSAISLGIRGALPTVFLCKDSLLVRPKNQSQHSPPENDGSDRCKLIITNQPVAVTVPKVVTRFMRQQRF